MKIAYIPLDGMTLLDFSEFYDPIKNIKIFRYLNDLDWDLFATKHLIQQLRVLQQLP